MMKASKELNYGIIFSRTTTSDETVTMAEYKSDNFYFNEWEMMNLGLARMNGDDNYLRCNRR